MQDLKNKVEKHFENNPDADKVFSTSDGFLFAQEMYATAHAATITDKEVLKHTKQNGVIAMAKPFVAVEVSTKTKDDAVIRAKRETVEAPNAMTSPTEVAGKVEVITEGVTTQVQDSLKNIEPAQEPAKVKQSAKGDVSEAVNTQIETALGNAETEKVLDSTDTLEPKEGAKPAEVKKAVAPKNTAAKTTIAKETK